MLITRVSQASGIERTIDIPCTEEQYNAWMNGGHIQVVMSNVSQDDREFILTGIIQKEWDEMFPEEEKETAGCPHCGSYEGDATECPECGHGQ